MVPQSRHTGGRVRAARPRLDEDWLYRTGQNLPVGCLSGKHSGLDKFQGKHAKSTTAKSNPGGTTWPVVGGIGRVWVLPFRHSPVAVGCQCFLLRQEHFVRNMGCHVFFYRLDAGVQGVVWRNQASLIMSAVSSMLRQHFPMHSNKSAISL